MTEEARNNACAAGSAGDRKEAERQPEGTPEQLAAIRHILKLAERKANLHEYLGVAEDATGAAIQQARNELHMVIQPDKNKDPSREAAQAMKAVNVAANVMLGAVSKQSRHRREEQEPGGFFTPEARSNTVGCAAGDTEPEGRPEQLAAVSRILKLAESKASLYEILGVPKDATEADIKQARNKLGLVIHPDKNPAPGATEAMKAVNSAAAVLLVPAARQKYDRSLAQNVLPNMTPEEMFNAFFSPEAQAALEKAMPWLAVGAGALLLGAGAYALISALTGGSKQEGSDDESD